MGITNMQLRLVLDTFLASSLPPFPFNPEMLLSLKPYPFTRKAALTTDSQGYTC